jgi:FkbM family methyltransferase
MNNIFEITEIESNGTIHFIFLGKEISDSYEVSLIDKNTNLIIHKTNIDLRNNYNYWISTGEDNAKRLKNIIFRIVYDGSNYDVNLNLFGESRFLVINSKQINLINLGDALFPIVCEIFYNKIYERDYVKVSYGDVVVDIGANYGVFSLYSQQFNPSKVFALEPIKKTFNCLSQNLKEFGVTCINKAIANEDGFEVFALTDVNGNNFSTKHSDGFHPSAMINQEIVETICFNSLVENYNIDKINFLKVDCEGGEYDLFMTIDKNYLQTNVEKIALEYHSHDIKNTILEILNDNKFTIEDVVGSSEIGLIYAYNKNFVKI